MTAGEALPDLCGACARSTCLRPVLCPKACLPLLFNRVVGVDTKLNGNVRLDRSTWFGFAAGALSVISDRVGRCSVNEPNHPHRQLLPVQRERQSRSAAHKRDEFVSPHGGTPSSLPSNLTTTRNDIGASQQDWRLMSEMGQKRKGSP